MYTNLSARALGLSLTPEETIALAAQTGFEGVDLLVRDLVDQRADVSALRARMNDRGIRGGCWPLPVDWRGEAEAFARDLACLPRYAEAAASLGLLRTGTWVMYETPGRSGCESARSADIADTAMRHVQRLGAIARTLDRFGIRFGLEVLGAASLRVGRGWPFVYRLDDFDQVLGAVWAESPNLGLIVDSFQLYAAGEGVEAGLQWGIGRIVAVHVADLPPGVPPDREAVQDNVRGLPGENGAIDSRFLLSRLIAGGFDGPIVAEPMAGCRSLAGLSPAQAAYRALSALHAIWPATVAGRDVPRPVQ